jgi:hypothetical protein
LVVDDVATEGAAGDFFKLVLVMPAAVGAVRLFVDESEGRLPDADYALPADWNPVEAKAIVDERAASDLDWRRGQHREVEPGWCKRFELKGVGEELEKALSRLEQKLRGGQSITAAGWVRTIVIVSALWLSVGSIQSSVGYFALLFQA